MTQTPPSDHCTCPTDERCCCGVRGDAVGDLLWRGGVVLSRGEGSVENDAPTEAAEIDAELRELQSFVMVETGHLPTVKAVAALRSRISKALIDFRPMPPAAPRP